jgi:phenylacetate-CoA ligase
MMYGSGLQKFVFPISNLLMRRNFWPIYQELQASQWYPQQRIEEIQLAKLRRLVEHAHGTVPLYKEMMDAKGVKPSDITQLEDIKKLPIITKKDFREGFPERCTSKAVQRDKWILDSTSGSTGNPFQFIKDSVFLDYRLANTLRNYTWTRMMLGSRMMSLWGYHETRLAGKVLDSMMRTKYLSAFDVEDNYREYYRKIRNYKPYLIAAYSSSVTHFARLLSQNGLTDLHIPVVISCAETLYPNNRALIEQVLHSQVFNRYGTRELGDVAHECDHHSGLHINAESYVAEVAKESNSDKHGKLIVTNLTNFTMPFIRYDTEDYATSSDEKCTCGRSLPMLMSVDGRVVDFIKLPSGRELSFLFFNHFFEQYGAYLRQFQVVQDKRNHITINLVTTSSYDKWNERTILRGIHSALGAEMQITINKVDRIEREKSGKTRPVKRLA